MSNHKGFPFGLVRLMQLVKTCAHNFGLVQCADQIAYEVVNPLRKKWGGEDIHFSVKSIKGKTAAFYEDIRRLAASSASKWGLGAAETNSFSETVLEQILQEMKGSDVYIGKGQAYEINRRDEYVFEQFGRMSTRELAAQFGLSSRQIYSIVKKMREQRKQRRLATRKLKQEEILNEKDH